MKTIRERLDGTPAWLMVAASALVVGLAAEQAAGLEQRSLVVRAKASAETDDQSANGPVTKQKKIVIEAIEPDSGNKAAKEVAWLGLSTEETPDALASQLRLNSGEGLVVTYVAPDSPAAKAGVEKNDVLVQFGDQLLVHPAQLRKLVQMHKEGDTLKLALYRGGKKQSLSATLGKTTRGSGLLLGEDVLQGPLEDLPRQLSDLKIGENIRQQMKAAREAMARAGVDKEKIRVEVERSVEEARKALQELSRHLTNAQSAFGPAAKFLEELARGGVDVEKDATVVVKNDRQSVKTIVTADDTGIYVIVANPKKRLTAHDKDGKLVFDGAIETPEEQAQVPKEVWEKVKPMLDKMGPVKAAPPDAEEDSSE
ncbi:MAG: PDZ domain-containing protein [Verrucomicrobiota bacterium]